MNKIDREFDCIQAKICMETRDMNFQELRAYLDKTLQNDTFWQRKKQIKRESVIMEADNNITDISLEMDNMYGKVGTPERDAFRREAYAYCAGQIIHDARKKEKITQAELAKRIEIEIVKTIY